MKKLLLILTLLLSTVSFAQHITVDEVDKFTDERIIQVNASKDKTWGMSDGITKNIFKGGVYLSTKLVKKPDGTIISYLNLNIQTGSILCFGGDKIIILFENNDKLTLNQTSKLDCATVNNIRFGLTEEDINILKNLKAKELRIYTRDGYIDYVIKDKAKPIIQETFELTATKLKEIQ